MENNFTKEIKNWLIDKLQDYKGQNEEVYACDLACLLTEGINMDGSVHYSTYKAEEFIKNNFEMFGDLVEYVKINFEMDLNPFLEPEKAEVLAYMEGVNYLLFQLKTIENLEGKIVLTDELIESIINELESNEFEIAF